MLHRLFGINKEKERILPELGGQETSGEAAPNKAETAIESLEKEDEKYQGLLGATVPKIEMTLSHFKSLPGHSRFKRR